MLTCFSDKHRALVVRDPLQIIDHGLEALIAELEEPLLLSTTEPPTWLSQLSNAVSLAVKLQKTSKVRLLMESFRVRLDMDDRSILRL